MLPCMLQDKYIFRIYEAFLSHIVFFLSCLPVTELLYGLRQDAGFIL